LRSIVADTESVFGVSLDASRSGVLNDDNWVRAVLGQVSNGGATNSRVGFDSLTAVHASHSNGGFKILSEGHQLFHFPSSSSMHPCILLRIETHVDPSLANPSMPLACRENP